MIPLRAKPRTNFNFSPFLLFDDPRTVHECQTFSGLSLLLFTTPCTFLLPPSRNRFPLSLSRHFFFPLLLQTAEVERFADHRAGSTPSAELKTTTSFHFLFVCVCFDVIILADIPAKVSITRPIESYHHSPPSATHSSAFLSTRGGFLSSNFPLGSRGREQRSKGIQRVAGEKKEKEEEEEERKVAYNLETRASQRWAQVSRG